jgi:hypothetical protein
MTEKELLANYVRACAEIARLRAALEMVEYLPCATEGMDGFSHCPWCEQFSDEPHAEDCPRQIALGCCKSVADKKEGVTETPSTVRLTG